MKKSLLQIIREEIQGFYSDWEMNDEPSIADKYYKRNLGISTNNPTPEEVSGELIGYLDKAWSTKLNEPVAVYKNPKNLRGYEEYTKAILIQNGDIYVAQKENGLHLNILELLVKEGIIPQSAYVANYGQRLPEEFITIIRSGNANQFVQSTAYDEFPIYYEVMFDEANKKHPYIKFKQLSPDAPRVWVDNSV